MKRTALAKKNSKSKSRSRTQFVVCIDNDGYPASLEVGKIYRRIGAHEHDLEGWMRIIDESGEDYLFPGERFVPVELPEKARRALKAAEA